MVCFISLFAYSVATNIPTLYRFVFAEIVPSYAVLPPVTEKLVPHQFCSIAKISFDDLPNGQVAETIIMLVQAVRGDLVYVSQTCESKNGVLHICKSCLRPMRRLLWEALRRVPCGNQGAGSQLTGGPAPKKPASLALSQSTLLSNSSDLILIYFSRLDERYAIGGC